MKTFIKTALTTVSILTLLCLPLPVSCQDVTVSYGEKELPEGAQSAKYLAYPTALQDAATAIYESRCQQGAEGLGPFSVSATQQVVFSPGNLQYQASTKTWRFAERQWDYIGDANKNISSSYSGWIDLFGWGTGNAPTKSSTNTSDYSSFTDWGTNQIGGDAPGTWRTLTKDEWVYLFHGRANYANLFGLGTVNGVQGTIILPDNWVTPAGLTFAPSTGKGLSWSSTYYANSKGDNFSHNTYTSAQWEKMEAAGAVFLPCAGGRNGTSVGDVGSNGYYWSSTQYSSSGAYDLYFYSYDLNPQDGYDRYGGFSVRLVSGL